MVETTLRAYRAGEPAVFLAAVAPYIKAMWAPYTTNLTTPYDDLTDYDKVRARAAADCPGQPAPSQGVGGAGPRRRRRAVEGRQAAGHPPFKPLAPAPLTRARHPPPAPRAPPGHA
jgi:hypothetical protein